MFSGNLLRRIDLFAVLSITVSFLLYLLTLAPSVTFFDSGEFITAIYSLGSAHSPGYPLFVNFAKPFTYLPFGNIAFRVNIATALSAALACYGVYLLVSYFLAAEALTEDKSWSGLYTKAIALAAALSFAFTGRMWLQSNHDKPYPLISFMAAMIFYLLFRWRDSYRQGADHPHYVYLGAFLAGLAFGAHQTMVLLVPAFAFLILAMDWRLICRIKEMLLAICFALLGFSVYLHLPVRATRNPLLNWGDSKTVSQFLWNFLRKGYPVDKPERNWDLLLTQLNAFSVPHEFTWVGLALLLVGLVAFMQKRRHEVVAYGIGILVFLLVIVGYFNTPAELIFLTEEFFTPLYLLSAVFIGLGLYYLLKRALASLPAAKMHSLPVQFFVGVIILVLPLTLCLRNYYENDQHENYIAYDYATNTFRSLSQGAALFTWGDSGAFPLWYLQGVERMREDLDLLHTPHLVFSWYLDSFPELFRYSVLRTIPLETQYPDTVLKIAIAEQLGRRPVFIDFSTRYSLPFDDYLLLQRGICYQLAKKTGGTLPPPELSVWTLYSERGVSVGEVPFRDLDTGKAILIYANCRAEGGEVLLRLGRFAEGIPQLRKAVAISPEMQAQVSQILAPYGIQ